MTDALREAGGITEINRKEIKGTEAALLFLTSPVEALGIGFERIQRGIEGAITPGANVLASKIIDATVGAEDFVEALEQSAEVVKEIKFPGTLPEIAQMTDEVIAIRHNFARQLISIDEQAQEDIAETWDDYFDDEANAWEQFQKSLVDIKQDAAKDLKKIDADLQKNLAKETKNLARDLSRLNRKEQQNIKRVQEKASKDTRNESRLRSIDALSDQRLFDFELRQLAARGEGSRILELLERRKIEEEIAREKSAVENEIGQETLTNEVQRIKEAASERRAELQLDSQERTSLLKEEAAVERQQRQADLAEKVADESANFQERIKELRQYRDKKLVNIEASKQEAIEVLGRELAEAKELTAKELADLIPVAGKLGENAGKSFADGLTRGFETNQKINTLLGNNGPDISQGQNGVSSFGILGFARGGTVPGSLGQPQLAVVHGGETVTPPGQTAINLSTTINASGGIDEDRINALFQDFVDNTLIPALG